MSDGSINEYVPSILNPKRYKKNSNINMSQISLASRCSLALKKTSKKLISEAKTLICEPMGYQSQSSQWKIDNQSQKSIPLSFKHQASPRESTIIYDLFKPHIAVSFGLNNCDTFEVASRNGAINSFKVCRDGKSTNVNCDLIEDSNISTYSELSKVDESAMNETSSPLKRSAVAVTLEIKKQKLSNADTAENSNVLILNTNAIEKISHVIVQPPNYKIVKRNKLNRNSGSVFKGNGVPLKQINIDRFFRKTDVSGTVESVIEQSSNDERDMSKNSGYIDVVKCNGRTVRTVRRESIESPKSVKLPVKREIGSPKSQDIRTSNSESPTPRVTSSSAYSSRKNVESLQFSLPAKSARSTRTQLSPRYIPRHKIVAGTHIAVDAFSYGEIPNVNHYFLTHFHSDHYSGLKKTFNKFLFCTKITADLCISRLGVNPKCIRIVNIDETLRVDGVEVTAVDANHCPGAIMLVFNLPNGKTLLHTGDFRANPLMESYPIFWNKNIHTIYLDTTYCNPRYDFPSQDQSLDMALNILREKKMALEKVGKKFSSVLIVCGTYTIGKEKFFLGMSRRLGCFVWACPEKERVLQIVEGRATSREPPQACQLHVVPMRDLTHEKLRTYLDSLQGAFSEVVAFKPSGWENGKNSNHEKDNVTICGIPYSEHSSFSELVRFVNFLKPKQVVPTVDISGGVKAVQKFFPCPIVCKEEPHCQTKLTDYFATHNRQQVPAVT